MTKQEFTDIYMPMADSLYRVAYYILEDSQDAEDAVQDLYLKLWDSRDKAAPADKPKAYCMTMMRNLCIDRIRRAGQRAAERQLDERIADNTDIERAATEREDLQSLKEAIARLPDSQREVMRLRVFEELPYEEISRRMGMNQLTLRVLLSRARKSIRNTI